MERAGYARSHLVFGLVALVLLVGAGILVVGGGMNQETKGGLGVVRAWSDGVDAPPGSTFYLLDINATDSGPSVWHLDPSLFSLTSNGTRSYAPEANYSALALMGREDIQPGHHVSGEVAFLLPADEAPSTLNYNGGGTVSVQPVGVPPVSGEASRYDPSVHFRLEGASTQSGAITEDGVTAWAAISNNSDALTFFGGETGYRNYSFVFFTGQEITVSFFFYYYKVPDAPNSLRIDSVASDDGYSVSNVLAWQTSFLGNAQGSALPATLTGYGSSAAVTLEVAVPPGPQSGVLHFTVQFSS